MKKLLFLIPLFYGLIVNGQNYLITFRGTGESITVSTVKVENLMKGTTLTVNGGDILRLTAATGINSIDDNQSSELKIYPNPMNDNSTMEIYPPEAGNAVISVLDITGKQIAQIQSYLENVRQDFRISGIKNGFYLINVKGNNYHFSAKLLSNVKSNGTISIEKINEIIQPVKKKSAKTNSKGTPSTFDMAYTTGDRLKFTGISGNNSTVKTDIPTSDKTITFNFISCTDADNNNYPILEIGSQIWMAENLKTTKYNNGDLIGTTTPRGLDISGESTPKYQWNNCGYDSSGCIIGRLYTLFAVTDSRSVCPSGWHASTDIDWKTMEMHLGMTQEQVDSTGHRGTYQGEQLKSTTSWDNVFHTYAKGTNTSGFTASPSGHRNSFGSFNGKGIDCDWWTPDPTDGYKRGLGCWDNKIDRSPNLSGNYGYSVRCLKDS